ncbi:hypothetical protein [Nocardia paucivorans]|uniref:hypothetical protein n=1 Tax=Nocardia paucivorans TaxID=114259 RepID=UPI00030F6FD8|nr:hypothetical protein [Nocardia paucivorans]
MRGSKVGKEREQVFVADGQVLVAGEPDEGAFDLSTMPPRRVESSIPRRAMAG